MAVTSYSYRTYYKSMVRGGTNPKNEQDGIHQALWESSLTGCNDPDPVTSRLA